MNVLDIKNKAWEQLSCFNAMNDKEFDEQAISFKISQDFNLVVWCDIDYDFEEIGVRYYIVSVRDNPYDDCFGNDIGAEYCTECNTKEELDKAIDYVLSHKSVKL